MKLIWFVTISDKEEVPDIWITRAYTKNEAIQNVITYARIEENGTEADECTYEARIDQGDAIIQASYITNKVLILALNKGAVLPKKRLALQIT